MPATACATCGTRLPSPRGDRGCPRRYCGVRCRRQREYARRRWDRLQGWIRAAELNSVWSGLTVLQREAHRQRGEELRREAGPRP